LVPEGYGDLVGLIGAEVRTTRLQAARAANTELIRMNWRIGRLILECQLTSHQVRLSFDSWPPLRSRGPGSLVVHCGGRWRASCVST
jgi:hypothetical protein